MDWVPSRSGKGLVVFPDLVVSAWCTDAAGAPHHAEFLESRGIRFEDVAAWLYIDEDGTTDIELAAGIVAYAALVWEAVGSVDLTPVGNPDWRT